MVSIQGVEERGDGDTLFIIAWSVKAVGAGREEPTDSCVINEPAARNALPGLILIGCLFHDAMDH
jgi:hypothetical protein